MSDLTLYRRLVQQARPHWRRLATLFALGLLASPLALLAPLPLKLGVDSVLGSRPLPGFLDAVLPAGVARAPAALLILVAVLALFIALLAQLQTFASTYLTAAAGEKLVLDFRARIFRHLQRLSLSYHDTVGTADSVYRIQTDAPAIRNVLVDGFIPLLGAALTLGGMLYVTVRIDWQLALVALAVSPPLLLAAHFYRPRLRAGSREVKKLESAALGVVQEVLGALRVVKAFGREDGESERFAGRAGQGVHGRLRLAAAEGRFAIVVGLVTAAGMALVLFVGVGHVRAGLLSLGDLLLVMGYIGKLYEPLKIISRKVATMQVHLASLERVFGVLDQLPEVTERPLARPVKRVQGAIAFRNVSFGYGRDRPVLHDVSFAIEPGARVGIVGATGAGKSTLICLLTRLYDPAAGDILLDGADIREYRLDDLRRQFAVVLQDPVLFSVSIAENIAYAVAGASREQIVAAARAANAHEFIERLPQGYDTAVGERGVKLSGGQRQRIALARAFLKDSPVLILDEPTSAVDQHTEAGIMEALEELQRGRTAIIISHRASTLRSCSAVVVLERGRVVDARDAAARAAGARNGRLDKHPAVAAWRELMPDAPAPERIEVLRQRRKSATFRLVGGGPGGESIIAQLSRVGKARVEQTLYEQILPHLPITAPHYYGSSADGPDFVWLFLEDVGNDPYSATDRAHLALAAHCVGVMHTTGAGIPAARSLPDGGPARYLDHLRVGRDTVQEHLSNPALTPDDVATARRLVADLDRLESAWAGIERVCAGMSPTLVHGDFRPRNAYVRERGSRLEVLPIDWEMAGWGVPAIDLLEIDLPIYWSVVRSRWPDVQLEDVRRLRTVGETFRWLAAIRWVAPQLRYDQPDWLSKPVATVRLAQRLFGAVVQTVEAAT